MPNHRFTNINSVYDSLENRIGNPLISSLKLKGSYLTYCLSVELRQLKPFKFSVWRFGLSSSQINLKPFKFTLSRFGIVKL